MARGSKPSGTKSSTLPASLVRERAHAPTPAQRIAQALERKPTAVTIPSTSTSVLREQALKGWKRARKVRLIEEGNVEWGDLYPTIL